MNLQSQRYRIIRPLGEGGMGIVYEAFDAERQSRVALKTMRSLDADALIRFKREFRAAQEARHPNLVELGELVSDQGGWFLTMELVEGGDFLEYVRPGYVSAPLASPIADTAVDPSSGSGSKIAPQGEADAGVGGVCDMPRLRGALRQLASGLVVLHAARCVHRDIKPSNIRVTRDGRVVLLDFGLILGEEKEARSQVVGTVAYMAPEQVTGNVSSKADLYSVGALLYEALTGRTPFTGAALDILHAKQEREPPPPRSLDPAVPADLDDLCMELLRIDPRRRPSADEVVARLEGAKPSPPAQVAPVEETPFVGRHPELAELKRAFDDSGPRAVAVLVEGESGIGKSNLVRHFTATLSSERRDVVVLTGRCHERESVPYKAFDGIVDALGRHLSGLSEREVEWALPIDAALLAQVFPVLRRVPAFANAPEPRRRAHDAHELRGRVFTAMRDLFARLAGRRPFILAIDDLQWADDDGLALISEVLRAPDAPGILVIGTMRPSPEKEPRVRTALPEARVLALAPFAPEESRELAERLLARSDARDSGTVRVLAAEAAGHPLFLTELAQRARSSGLEGGTSERLDDVLWGRFAKLEGGARRLLALSILSDVPLDPKTLALAAKLEIAEVMREIPSLRAARLVKVASDGESVEPYHDRLREAVSARLEPEDVREKHERLAVAMTERGRTGAETIGQHWLAAGDKGRAAECLLRAAEGAEGAFAFDHAARLYATVLDLRGAGANGSLAIATARARALANAGKSGEAGVAYKAAADHASGEEARTLRRLAADQLLRGGHIDQGVATIRVELVDAGFRYPATPLGALVALLFCRALLYFRGFRFRERGAREIPPDELARIDLCWAAALGLSLVDPARGAYFISLHLLEALRLGEPARIAKGAGMDSSYVASRGAGAARAVERQSKFAIDLAHRTGDPAAIAIATLGRALGFFLQGRFAEASVDAMQAEEACRQHRLEGWELSNARSFAAGAMVLQGRFADLAKVLPGWEKDAIELGDRTAIRSTRVGEFVYVWLAQGAPSLAKEQVALAMKGWSREGFLVEHFLEAVSYATVDLYEGDIAAARARMRSCEAGMRRSLLVRVESLWVRREDLAARIELAAARGSLDDRALAKADGAQRRIARTGSVWAAGIAALLEAQIAHLRSDAVRARESLRRAVEKLDAGELYLQAATARHALGVLTGENALVDRADEWFRAESIKAPELLRAVIAPGFPGGRRAGAG
ncbi:MAG: serine/threonine-protein kinase PknK [Polyangiaceae bacterium]